MEGAGEGGVRQGDGDQGGAAQAGEARAARVQVRTEVRAEGGLPQRDDPSAERSSIWFQPEPGGGEREEARGDLGRHLGEEGTVPRPEGDELVVEGGQLPRALADRGEGGADHDQVAAASRLVEAAQGQVGALLHRDQPSKGD